MCCPGSPSPRQRLGREQQAHTGHSEGVLGSRTLETGERSLEGKSRLPEEEEPAPHCYPRALWSHSHVIGASPNPAAWGRKPQILLGRGRIGPGANSAETAGMGLKRLGPTTQSAGNLPTSKEQRNRAGSASPLTGL